MSLTKYCVYRYIDKKTNKIVYIGKTNQLFVTNRLEQHKTDNVGIWAKKNEYYIEFIELPREEDMNYIESYLIRKIKPELNIALATQSAPPFNIVIEEDKWKNLDDYLKEKEIAKYRPVEIFTNRFAQIEESNKMFSQNIDDIITKISLKDKNFIKKICFSNDLRKDSISIPVQDIWKCYEINSISDVEIVCHRLVLYTQTSRIEGTTNDVKKIGLFDKYMFADNNVVFFLNTYVKKFLERM